MRNNIFGYILLLILVLLIAGVISIGDVVNVFLYIGLGVFLLILAGIFALRIKLNRIRKEMEKGGSGNPYYKSYTWGGRRQSNASRNDASQMAEGEIKIENTVHQKSKLVSNNVGDYAEYEEISEESGGSR